MEKKENNSKELEKDSPTSVVANDTSDNNKIAEDSKEKVDDAKKEKKNSNTKEDKAKLQRKQQLKEQRNKFAIENDFDLQRKQLLENRRVRKSFVVNGVILLVGVGLALFLASIIHTYFVGLAIPVLGITVYKIVREFLGLSKLKSAYELRKMLIIEQARKVHNEKNKQIIEAYKAEKQRIKSLKRLPYRILNYVSFLISMFSIIFFFFILDIGIAPTALVLFGLFTVTYFITGILMMVVFYMISENKQRESKLKLEEEKNRLLFEERIRNEEVVRVKLEKERRKYEEEERLRIEEQIRRAKEEEEKARLEAEIKVIEDEKARIKAEEKERKLKEREEREKAKQNMIKDSRFMRQDYLPPAPSRAEIAKDIEVLRNEFDKNLLDEIGNRFDDLNISGIEYFSNKEKIKEEYAAGMTFPDVDLSDEGLEIEIDNSLLQTAKKETVRETDVLTDFDTADIEEAKTKIFENAKRLKTQKSQIDTDDEITTKDLVKEVARKMSSPTTVKKNEPAKPTSSNESSSNGKNVSGKSFMVIKQMLKDN